MSFRICCSFILLVMVATQCVGQNKLPVVRKVISRESKINLDNWQVSIDGEKSWKIVRGPKSVEDAIEMKFDGISIHKSRFFKFQIPKHHRVYLNFDAVATHATVWVEGTKVGEHLGGWTPFRFDITDIIQASKKRQLEIKVRCDERVGHNTQGFLPVFAPHFSGMWKPAFLTIVPNLHVDSQKVHITGGKEFQLHVPLVGWDKSKIADLMIEVPLPKLDKKKFVEDFQKKFANELGVRPFFDSFHKKLAFYFRLGDNRGPFRAQVVNNAIKLNWMNLAPKTWSLDKPDLNEIRVAVIDLSDRRRATISNFYTKTSHREFKTRGKQFLLNGKPIQIRGLLNWGYAPPSNAPTLDRNFMRREIQFAKDRGFNLMKFCLWIPPKDYLDLCDEMGMLAWVEYPTWHPKFTPEKLGELKAEYAEFFHYVRPHPSVVLHSLTCETGPSADLKVIQQLYDLCKKENPGAVVEDDSSWIGWNRIHDFYDDHPYGNNHTWVATLARLKKHIADRKTKPLILGEAIAADTWFDPTKMLSKFGMRQPHWAPGFLHDNARWGKEIMDRGKPDDAAGIAERLKKLKDDSFRYAHAMRKYQIETFRREVPEGGYIISVIRDVPLCGMGLIDYEGKPKTSPEQWSWHRDVTLLLKTADDRRSFSATEKIAFEIMVSNFSNSEIAKSNLLVEISDRTAKHFRYKTVSVPPTGTGTNAKPIEFSFDFKQVSKPTPFWITATLETPKQEIKNRWKIWLFPKPSPTSDSTATVFEHPSFAKIKSQFQIKTEPITKKRKPVQGDFIVTTEIDKALLETAKLGSNIILLANNRPGSFKTQDHWFLRGGPIVDERMNKLLARAALVDLQHFDLGGPVVFEIGQYQTADLLFGLWDNHDLKRVKTHGLIFSMPVGKGKIVVSSLKHSGKTNAVGQFLLRQLINNQIADRPGSNRSADAEVNAKILLGQLNANAIDLSKSPWQFQPDPKETGFKSKWYASDFEDSDWKKIRIDKHWESQGYKALDKWAWYRLKTKIPKDWKGKKIYLNFTGVDDHYQLYVNGQHAGSDGNIETKTTAFDNRTSWDLTKHVTPGETLTIAVAVYDWQGAGGIFRPVTLSNLPIQKRKPLVVSRQ